MGQRYQCFNTQPPEGGWTHAKYRFCSFSGFNTQPPEGGWASLQYGVLAQKGFQHTAARRRLVSIRIRTNNNRQRFNTQPPEGGWFG